MSEAATATATMDLEEGGGTASVPRHRNLEPIKEHTWYDLFLGGLATVTAGACVASASIAATPLVIVAGVSGALIAPYTYYQQRNLEDTKNLTATHEALKEEVDFMTAENDRLEESVKELTATLSRLEEVEGALNALNDVSGQSVEEFRGQVETNKKILMDMRVNLKANVRQNLLSVLIRSDTDGDGTIDAREIETLIKRIQNVNGLKINEDNFRAAIVKSGGSLRAVMDIVKDMLTDNLSRKSVSNEIFEITD